MSFFLALLPVTLTSTFYSKFMSQCDSFFDYKDKFFLQEI